MASTLGSTIPNPHPFRWAPLILALGFRLSHVHFTAGTGILRFRSILRCRAFLSVLAPVRCLILLAWPSKMGAWRLHWEVRRILFLGSSICTGCIVSSCVPSVTEKKCAIHPSRFCGTRVLDSSLLRVLPKTKIAHGDNMH